MASSSSFPNSPCGACKFLGRKCVPGCIFAPYFPPEDPIKFANVHRVFGASNVGKLLSDLQPHQREVAANSLAYEAEARMRDPVYGCVGTIAVLQAQLMNFQRELDATNAELMKYANREVGSSGGVVINNNQMGNQQRSFNSSGGIASASASDQTSHQLNDDVSGNNNPEADDE